MNKLLQHIIDAGDVDHRILPGLQKMQMAGTVKPKRGETVIVDGKKMNTYSDEYENAYKKGIGQWVSYDKDSGQWKPLPSNLPSSAYKNAEFVSGVTELPEVTVTAKMNPYLSAARKKAKADAGDLEAFRKQQEAGYPKWYKHSTLYNPEKDKQTQEDLYNSLINRRSYQNVVDAIPQTEGESRVDYINRINNLAGKNFVQQARAANVTEPFEPSNLNKLGQWGWKGINHIGAGIQALAGSSPGGIPNYQMMQSAIQRGIDRGNQPVSGMLPDEARQVGITQPFETLDDIAYNYGFKPALRAGDNFVDPANKKAREFNGRYLGPSESDKIFTSLLNPINYVSGAEIFNGGRNLAKVARIGEGLGTAGKFLTESTPLRNAWKINPYAEKLTGKVQRQIFGDPAYQSFLKYGPTTQPEISTGDQISQWLKLNRESSTVPVTRTGENMQVAGTTRINSNGMREGVDYPFAYFSEGSPWYGPKRSASMAESLGTERRIVPKSDNLIFYPAGETSIVTNPDELLQSTIQNYAGRRRVLSPFGDAFNPEAFDVYKGDPHWLKGYQLENSGKGINKNFGPGNNNTGFLNYMTAKGVEFNPAGIVKDYYNGLMNGLPDAIPNALGKFLRKTGIKPNAKNVGRPFSDVFPTGARRDELMALQDAGFQHGQDFMNEYLYPGGSSELRPEVANRIREIIPDSKLATNTDNFNLTDIVNGKEVGNLENPYIGTQQRLVKSTAWGSGRENVPLDDLNVLIRDRGSVRGVNIGDSGNSYTLRNFGPYYESPFQVARTGVHENAHSFQKFGFRPSGSTDISTWGEQLSKYNPKFKYYTPNLDTDAGKAFAEHMIEPTKKTAWESAPIELHSELMAEKYKDLINSIRSSQVPNAMLNKDLHVDLINELANPTDKTLTRILSRGNLDKHFKPETTLENKIKLLKMLPAALPVAGAAAAMGAPQQQRYGGENNMYRVFAEDGVEYKGPSIVDYLATKGYSGSKAFRKGLAEKYGVENYNYSAAKNTELLNKLRENDDILEKEYEQTQTPISVEKIMQMEQQAQARPQKVRITQAPAAQPSYYFPRPDFMDMEVPKTKLNISLKPKVVYDKFSLKPSMVIAMPKPAATTNTQVQQPQPVRATGDSTLLTPRANYPSFDPYFFANNAAKQNQVALPADSVPQKSSLDSTRVAQVNPQTVSPKVEKFDFRSPFYSYDPSNPFAFLQQKQSTLGPYIPANKPVVDTKMNDSKEEETTWYEDLWNGFSDAVNKSPLDFSKMTMSPAGFTPEGVQEINKDINAAGRKAIINISKFVSPEKGKIVENYFKRQDLKNNDNLQETKTKFNIPTTGRPAIATGDTINIDKNRYVIPAMIDLNQTNWGVRNRDEYKDINTEAADITTFQSFENAKDYFNKNPKDAATSTYIGVDPSGKVKVGNKADFLNSNYRITKTFGNKIVDFVDEADGSMKLKNSSSKASNKHLSPVVRVLGDDGKMTEGSMNLLIPKGNRDTKSFGQITGGRVIFKTPKGEQFLVSGSAEDIRRAFKQIKGDNPYVEAVTLDNGSYAMGLRNKNQKITAQELRDYQGSNTTGSAFLYLQPGNYTRGTNQAAPQTQFRDVQMNTPNIRTKNDESFKKGHPLTNEQKAIILHHTGYSDTTGVSRGMSKAMQGVAKQFSQPGESSHVVIDFDGTRYNYARPDQVTFHAGKSMFNGRDNVNDFGIGIEFQGDTDKTRLTDKQINSFVEYAGPIIKKNKIPLSSIITHKQIRTNYMKANPGDKQVLGKPDVNEIDYKRIIQALKKKGYYAQGGPVVDPMGQWAHPGQVTRIPGSNITMQGVPYPVLGVGSNGQQQMMYPGQEYSFGGAEHVDEYPIMENGGIIPQYQMAGPVSKTDSVRHQAGKILKYEQLRGGPGGSPLSYYSDPSYMNMLMDTIYPQVNKILPNASAMEASEAMDFIFNAGWDKTGKKITKDPRAYALQEYYRQYDPSKLDQDGKWPGRKNAPYSFDQEYNTTIGKLPENQRRILMNKGRDWYYQNTAPKGSTWDLKTQGSYPDYKDTWYGRIWNTNDYQPFNPNNPNFIPKKEMGGGLLSKSVTCSNCGWSWESVDGGADPLTCHKCGGTAKMKGGGYVVTRSHDRKGKTHKVTGPDGTVKYFGDSKMGQHPNDPARKKAFYSRHKHNLEHNPFFRAFARKTWETGGQTGYMQGGGLWDTDKVGYLDSTVNANKNLEFIRRAMQDNGPTIPTPKGVPGYKPGQTSSHLMTYDPKSARSYPEVVNMNGGLKYITGDDAYNYAEDNGEYIQFPTAEQAKYFSQNYKKSNYIKVGKQPLEKKHGINVNYKK